jgi:hypothetical protein
MIKKKKLGSTLRVCNSLGEVGNAVATAVGLFFHADDYIWCSVDVPYAKLRELGAENPLEHSQLSVNEKLLYFGARLDQSMELQPKSDVCTVKNARKLPRNIFNKFSDSVVKFNQELKALKDPADPADPGTLSTDFGD